MLEWFGVSYFVRIWRTDVQCASLMDQRSGPLAVMSLKVQLETGRGMKNLSRHGKLKDFKRWLSYFRFVWYLLLPITQLRNMLLLSSIGLSDLFCWTFLLPATVIGGNGTLHRCCVEKEICMRTCGMPWKKCGRQFEKCFLAKFFLQSIDWQGVWCEHWRNW